MDRLLKISFLIAIFGILFLLILANTLPIKQINIHEINNKNLDKKVKVQGTILNIKNYNDFQVISIKDSTGKIDITLDKPTNLSNNNKITVIGSLTEYKQVLQIQADKIIVSP